MIMQPSVVGTLFDLLEFEARGTLGQLDRCFRKVCAYYSLDLDDALRRKLRNIAFWYLRSTGYLDASYSASALMWSTAPPNLVQRGDHDFALIGGSAPAAAVVAGTSRGSLREERSPDSNLVPTTVPFFPALLCLSATVEEARNLSRLANISLGLSYQSQVFQHLPSLDTVLRRTVVREDAIAPFEPESTDRFDFASCAWYRFSETRALDAGLYRRTFEYGIPKYTIVAPSHGKRLTSFSVVQREWLLVAALALLRKVLPIHYDKTTARLYLSRRYQPWLRLPTLLERSLRSGTLLNPSIEQEWFVYDGVLGSSVDRLVAKLPMFNAGGRR